MVHFPFFVVDACMEAKITRYAKGHIASLKINQAGHDFSMAKTKSFICFQCSTWIIQV